MMPSVRGSGAAARRARRRRARRRQHGDGRGACRALRRLPRGTRPAPGGAQSAARRRRPPQAPPGLRSAASRRLPELNLKPANQNRVASWLAPGLVGAVAASLAMVDRAALGSQALVEQELVSSHVRSLQPGHLTDVQTTNQHIVKPWFNGRIDFAPPVPELADAAFRWPAGGSIRSTARPSRRSSIIAAFTS